MADRLADGEPEGSLQTLKSTSPFTERIFRIQRGEATCPGSPSQAEKELGRSISPLWLETAISLWQQKGWSGFMGTAMFPPSDHWEGALWCIHSWVGIKSKPPSLASMVLHNPAPSGSTASLIYHNSFTSVKYFLLHHSPVLTPSFLWANTKSEIIRTVI